MLSRNIMERSSSKKKFAQVLIEKNIINPEQLDKAIKIQKTHSCSLNEAILKLGYIDEKEQLLILSAYLSIPPIKVSNLRISGTLLKSIPQEVAVKYQVIPVGKIGSTLTVAMADPLNVVALDDLERLTGCEINPVIGLRGEINQSIDVHYKKSVVDTVDEIIKDTEMESIEVIEEEAKVGTEELLRSIEEAPVIKLTNYILRKGVELRASDILIEPLSKKARVRLRVDGLLRENETFSKKMHDFVVSRIKVIANLNITEHRLPQDGRFRMNILNREVDFRVSILPSVQGEKVVLRVLDKSQGVTNLDVLGFDKGLERRLKEDAISSYGMLLACRPRSTPSDPR